MAALYPNAPIWFVVRKNDHHHSRRDIAGKASQTRTQYSIIFSTTWHGKYVITPPRCSLFSWVKYAFTFGTPETRTCLTLEHLLVLRTHFEGGTEAILTKQEPTNGTSEKSTRVGRQTINENT